MRKELKLAILLCCIVFCALPLGAIGFFYFVIVREVSEITGSLMNPEPASSKSSVPVGLIYSWQPLTYQDGEIVRVGQYEIPLKIRTPALIKPLGNEALASLNGSQKVFFIFFPAKKEHLIKQVIIEDYDCFVDPGQVSSDNRSSYTSGADITIEDSYTNNSVSFSDSWIYGSKTGQSQLKGNFLQEVNSPESPVATDPRLRTVAINFGQL